MTHSSDEINIPATAPPAQAEARREPVHFEKERGVTEIRVQGNVAHVIVQLDGTDIGSERLKVLQSLAGSNVPLFLVKLLPKGLSFAIRGENLAACDTALKQTRVVFNVAPELSVVTTVAGAMRDLSGIMAVIYEALNEANIRVQQTGDAYNAVLCLVEGSLSEKAARVLRKRFSLEESGGSRGDGSDQEPAQETEVPGTGLKAL